LKDGVISFKEFYSNVMPKDITPGEADGVNIKEATNTLLGNHSKSLPLNILFLVTRLCIF